MEAHLFHLSLPLNSLLADGFGATTTAPTWTDKEVLIVVGYTIAALIPIVLFLLRFTAWGTREKVRKAKLEIEKLNTALGVKDKQLQDTTKRLNDTQNLAAQMQTELVTAQGEATSLRQLADSLEVSLVSMRENWSSSQSQLEDERRRVQKALQKDGQTWTERVKYNAPEFDPLAPEGRRMPIISVLNLKGGVGKTTICANLGAALDGMGYRVLLLDLDLQGSLTSLFLSDTEQETLNREERTLADFLAASFGAEYPNLPLDYTQPILPDRKSGLVPTNDFMAYAETNLTIRWLLREGTRDPRFLLRKELHLKRITNEYDIVFLDCPPLINVCCVNALAASDYLLIPVMPSKQATARAPILLQRLKEFRTTINPHLKVMGVVANRTHWSDLTADEQSRLTLLRDQCKDVLCEEVPQFKRFIRQNAEFRTVEDQCRPMRPGDEMFEAFLELAREVESRLPMFCQPAAKLTSPAKVVLT
jgi:cellulose biosynthesis protein BcsQ